MIIYLNFPNRLIYDIYGNIHLYTYIQYIKFYFTYNVPKHNTYIYMIIYILYNV